MIVVSQRCDPGASEVSLPLHMLYRFSTFLVSISCIFAVSRVNNEVASLGGMAIVHVRSEMWRIRAFWIGERGSCWKPGFV